MSTSGFQPPLSHRSFPCQFEYTTSIITFNPRFPWVCTYFAVSKIRGIPPRIKKHPSGPSMTDQNYTTTRTDVRAMPHDVPSS